ncbi:hypothetical protein CPB83DRAFT_899017 [Crepidotus variabilis]|uniref:Uncharacterized protein n=1 Tax=Crepidotus variabilis TaxID=179855 RepID=A0A9P6JJE5_9AGAR|nr:hypothetical protein CPB83DRAFT_899017 [Crepidotus variabilis]
MPPAQPGLSKRKATSTAAPPPLSKKHNAGATEEEEVLVANTSDIEQDNNPKSLDLNELVLMRAERDKAFVGFGIMTFVTRRDPGQASLSLQSINTRNVTEANLTKLKKAFSGNQDFSLLDRFNSAHAITILVDAKFLDKVTITKDPAADQYQLAKWIETTEPLNAELQNGNHWRIILREIAGKDWSDYAKLVERIKKCDQGTLATNKMIQSKNHLEKTVLPPKMKWLVRFFDKETIHASPYKSEILLDLVSNKAVAQNEDTQNNALHLAINHILCEPFEKREDKIAQSAKSSPMVERMPAPLKTIFKDRTLFWVLTRLHQFNLLWAQEIQLTVNSIKGWRVSASPIMQLILAQGVSCLEYLFSHHDPNLKQTDREIRHSITPLFEADMAIPNIADHSFFVIVHEAYTSLLYPHREAFGLTSHSTRDSNAYQQAHKEYVAKLTKKLATWAKERSEFFKSSAAPPLEAQAVLETFPKRLEVVLSRGVLQSVNWGMPMPVTKYPILSGCFIIDIAKQLDSIKVQLSMVLAWIDPYLGLNFPSGQATGLMPPLVHAIDRLNPRHLESDGVINKLLGCIFNQRGSALLRMKTLVAACTSTVDSVQLSDIGKSEDWGTTTKQAIASFVKAWRSNASAKYSRDILSHGPPPVESMPENELKTGAISKLEQEDQDLIISALVNTYYPWAGGEANTTHNRNQSTANRAFEAVKFALFTSRHFSLDPAVVALRIQLADILSHYTINFKWYWDGVVLEEEEDDEEVLPPSSQANFSNRSATALNAEANSIALHTKNVVQQIASLITHKDAGAIPVMTNDKDKDKVVYHVAEDVYYAAETLFEALAVASARAQRMYTHPTTDRRLQLPRSEVKELAAAVAPSIMFTPAPQEDTDLFYSHCNMEELADVKSFGIGSLLLQKRIASAAAKQEKMANKKSKVKAGKMKMVEEPKPKKTLEDTAASSDYGDGGFNDATLMEIDLSGEDKILSFSSQTFAKDGEA